MSPERSVRRDRPAAELSVTAAMALWLAASVGMAFVLAGRGEMAARTAGGAAALAFAPAVLTLLMAPRWGESWALAAAGAGWTAAAAAAVALTGGLGSPLLAAGLIGPALLARAGRGDLAAESAAFGLLGLSVAALPAALGAPIPAGGHAAGPFALLALGLAGGLLAAPRAPRPPLAAALPPGLAVAAVTAEGVIAGATLGFARQFGASPDALRGRALGSLVGAAAGETAAGAVRAALAAARTSAAPATASLALGGPGGGRRTLAVSVWPLGAGASVSLTDVTAFAEAAAAADAARLAAAGASAAKTRHVADLSHELRTPLTHILGFAEMIQLQPFGPLGERYLEYTGLIRQSGAHLLDLVNRMLDLSKIEAGRFELERERFDARELVGEVVRLNQDAAARAGVALAADVPAGALEVDADPRAVRQILINLVGNAVKFTPEGGAVAVRARAEAGALVLEAEDDGPGIPDAEKARLGRPYEQGAAAGGKQGTGLGLALVRALAELHGGALSFHDAPRRGALVRVRLPVLR